MKLKDARHRANLTQSELADMAGTTYVNISLYERDKVLPNPKTRRALQEALGTNIEWQFRTHNELTSNEKEQLELLIGFLANSFGYEKARFMMNCISTNDVRKILHYLRTGETMQEPLIGPGIKPEDE